MSLSLSPLFSSIVMLWETYSEILICPFNTKDQMESCYMAVSTGDPKLQKVLHFWCHKHFFLCMDSFKRTDGSSKQKERQILQCVPWAFSSLGLFSLEKRRFSGDLVAGYNYMVKGFKEDRSRLFLEAQNSRTRGSKPKLEHGKFPLDIRKSLLPEK